MANFGDYPGDTLIWRPGDSLQNLESPELSGELTVLHDYLLEYQSNAQIHKQQLTCNAKDFTEPSPWLNIVKDQSVSNIQHCLPRDRLCFPCSDK